MAANEPRSGARAAARKLSTGVVLPLTDAGATDGWNLATRGYVPQSASVPHTRARGHGAQQRLGW